jgi:hypothetical protein
MGPDEAKPKTDKPRTDQDDTTPLRIVPGTDTRSGRDDLPKPETVKPPRIGEEGPEQRGRP